MSENIIKKALEHEYAHELTALQEADDSIKPPGWNLSPQSVCTFIMGGEIISGVRIEEKYIGPRANIEIAVATLMSSQALLIAGIPGTAKTFVSELLAAAISGDSTLMIQGASGTTEQDFSYNWNYGLLLRDGPTEHALIQSPVMRAMQQGKLVRIEELTRIPQEIQDNLLTILSEKVVTIPELKTEKRAVWGFNVIATANDRDKGTHTLSSAMQRRFNTVRLAVPETIEEEVAIVTQRLKKQMNTNFVLDSIDGSDIAKTIQIFRELRAGKTADNKQKLQKPSTPLSTAEIIACVENYNYLSSLFTPNSKVGYKAKSLWNTIVREPNDAMALQEYMETVMRKRGAYLELYEALKKIADSENA